MPNWVMNQITFIGDKKNINNVLKLIGNQKADDDNSRIIDFNKLIPMPECYNDIEASSYSDAAYDYYLAKILDKEPASKQFFKNKTKKEAIDFVEKDDRFQSFDMLKIGEKMYNAIINYGAKDWYDYRINKWGTKWLARDCNLYDNVLYFTTAWSFPTGIMEKVALICAENDVDMEGCWADEDCGCNTGYFDMVNGELSSCYNDNCSSEAYETYVECWGETPCIYKDENGDYHHYRCSRKCPDYEYCHE